MSVCAGCGLELPDEPGPQPPGYNASAECYRLYGEVIAYGLAHPAVLGRWHQTATDAYALQHLLPTTKPLTTAFALNSLYLVFERGLTGIQSRRAHSHLANTVDSWPRFQPPPHPVNDVTVFDVAMASSPQEHASLVAAWGASVWAQWSHVHDQVATMTDRQLQDWHP